MSKDPRVAVAEAALDRAIMEASKANARAEKALAMGTDDEFEGGVVLMWDRTFDNGVTYHYCAIKNGSVWYLTGRDVNPLSWITVVERHLIHADAVWFASEATQVWPLA